LALDAMLGIEVPPVRPQVIRLVARRDGGVPDLRT
jgi:hypothetical protein